ncbi:MAG: ROK family transcriptional regulator [Kosmotogaceae bacterium]
MTNALLNISRFIWKTKSTTISEISEEIGVDKSTVSRRINELKDIEFLHADGEIAPGSTGGRKTTVFSLSKERFHIIGLDVHQDGIEGVITNLAGEIEDSFSIHEQITKDNIASLISTAVKNRTQKYKIYGAGISLPGIIDSVNGMVVYSKALGISKLNLMKKLSSSLKIPIIMENDSNIGATYYNSKLWQDSRNILYFYISVPYKLKDPVGVGVGISFSNELYQGSNNHAGEYEFNLYLTDKKIANDLDYFSFLEKYSNNEIYQEVKNFIDDISQKLAFLISIFDPDTVIINGNIRFLPDSVLNALTEKIQSNVFMADRREIKFIKEKKEDALNAIGASLNFLQKVFSKEEQLISFLNCLKKEAHKSDKK